MADFKDIVGQEHLKEQLQKNMKEGNVSHAYLINGELRSGKEFIAKIFAAALQCEDELNPPCQSCQSCVKAFSGNHPDIIFVSHEKPNTIGVEDIRTQINNDIMLKPYQGPYKIYIMNEAEKMTVQAQNALLKTLEEPPAYAMFILATTEPHKIPMTILSRCQRFDFKQLTMTELTEELAYICEKEGISISDEALNGIAEAAEGGMRDALSILDQASVYAEKEVTVDDVNSVTGNISNQKLLLL